MLANQTSPEFADSLAVLEGPAAQAARTTGVRVTLIRLDGRVLFDTDEDAAQLDNHANRPEVAAALAGEDGHSSRYSVSLARQMLYFAIPVRSDARIVGVVRVAVPASPVDAQMSSIRGKIFGVALLIGAVAVGLAWFFIRRAVEPVEQLAAAASRFAEGDLSGGLPAVEFEELTGLSDAIMQLALQVDERSRVLGRKGYEQQAVLASMAEGVLAVDSDERVISLNRAAAELIGSRQADVPGRSLQEVLRNAELRRFARRALESEEPIETDVVLHGQGDKILRVRGTATATQPAGAPAP